MCLAACGREPVQSWSGRFYGRYPDILPEGVPSGLPRISSRRPRRAGSNDLLDDRVPALVAIGLNQFEPRDGEDGESGTRLAT